VLGLEVIFVELGLNVVELDLPPMPGLVSGLEAVRVDVGIADSVAVSVNAKLLSAFIPMAPGVDCAVRLKVIAFSALRGTPRRWCCT
jgi:hypothetical protein